MNQGKKKFNKWNLVPIGIWVVLFVYLAKAACTNMSYVCILIVATSVAAGIVDELLPRSDIELLGKLQQYKKQAKFHRFALEYLLVSIIALTAVIVQTYKPSEYRVSVLDAIIKQDTQLLVEDDVMVPSSLKDMVAAIYVGSDLQEKLLSGAESIEHYPESSESGDIVLALVCKYANEIIDKYDGDTDSVLAADMEFANYLKSYVKSSSRDWMVILVVELLLLVMVVTALRSFITTILLTRHIPKGKTINDVIAELNKKVYPEQASKSSELAASIVETFEDLLTEKNIEIPCSSEEEESKRHADGNEAKLYGVEYWHLIDEVESRLPKRRV